NGGQMREHEARRAGIVERQRRGLGPGRALFRLVRIEVEIRRPLPEGRDSLLDRLAAEYIVRVPRELHGLRLEDGTHFDRQPGGSATGEIGHVKVEWDLARGD